MANCEYPDQTANFEIISFCFVVAMSDLVHQVKAICRLLKLLTACGNLFLNMPIAVSRASFIFQKKFIHAVNS